MKTFFMSLLLFALGTSAMCAQGFDDSNVDQALIIINDQILTESMVTDIAERIMRANENVDMTQAGSAALRIGISRILYRESFLRLGLDESMLDPQVASRIDTLIREDGSRQRFLDKVKRDGYQSIEAFQAALRHQFIEGTVRGIVSGSIPSPNDGKRTISEPTPAELRTAYAENEKYRKRPAEFEWATLKFLNDPTMAPAAERAAETLNRLGAQMMSIEAALAKADRVSFFDQIRPGSKKNLKKFLETAAEGECMELSSSVSGVIQLVLITKRSEAQEFSFSESQLFIMQDLKRIAEGRAVEAELSTMWQSSYIWVSTLLPGLKEQLDREFGVVSSEHEAVEL